MCLDESNPIARWKRDVIRKGESTAKETKCGIWYLEREAVTLTVGAKKLKRGIDTL